ncbi:uncharacterized protein LOC127750631 [Frankliniella occidentalis]|uniref:Uncharacterized protein LOC127750631 n=1 Tax=Frankliniella occidentalis TaxID=133901 RepID=A0A9C6X3Y8_FRAOC|nr:uncharacterized protein LOC127750631 [Frankliniella occidentalis]
MSAQMVLDLVEILRPHLPETTSSLAIPVERKVLAAIYFFAHGCYHQSVGQNVDFPMGRTTAQDCIHMVTGALNNRDVVRRFIKFPRTKEELNLTIRRNQELRVKIPNTVGYVDGTLVQIMKPGVDYNVDAYIRRKSTPCLNVQVSGV